MRLVFKELILLSVIALFGAILGVSMVRADPDPISVAWLVMDPAGTPVNGASLTIYYATSNPGTFAIIPASNVLDKLPNPNVYRNPIFSGYYNPDLSAGIAFANIIEKDLGDPSSLWYYVSITYGSDTWIWPVATSTKPGDPSWAAVVHPGSPSGYAAYHPGMGNGVTTAYPTRPPRPPSVPEFSFATPLVTSMGAILFIVGKKVYKRKRD